MLMARDEIGEAMVSSPGLFRLFRPARSKADSPQVVVLDVDIQVRQNELYSTTREMGVSASVISQAGRERPGREQRARNRLLTSSLIFFQMILVISSPSSSTTGPLTLIFSPEKATKGERK